MVDPWDDFRRFEEMMNRMFENFSGRPTSRRLLPSGERGAVVPSEYREPFLDVMESDKEIIATEIQEENTTYDRVRWPIRSDKLHLYSQ